MSIHRLKDLEQQRREIALEIDSRAKNLSEADEESFQELLYQYTQLQIRIQILRQAEHKHDDKGEKHDK